MQEKRHVFTTIPVLKLSVISHNFRISFDFIIDFFFGVMKSLDNMTEKIVFRQIHEKNETFTNTQVCL